MIASIKHLLKAWPIIVSIGSSLVGFGIAKATIDENTRDISRLLEREQKTDEVFKDIYIRGTRVEDNLKHNNELLEQMRDDIRDMHEDVRQIMRRR